MYCRCRARAGRLMMCSAKEVVLLTQARTLASPTAPLSRPANVRPSPDPNRSMVTMTTTNDPLEVEAIFQQKWSLRSKIRKELKNMDPIRRSEEDNAIQRIVLGAPWFKASKSLCAYISSAALREVDTSRIVSEVLSKPIEVQKKLYVPRVEERNSNMRMLRITNVDDLIANSMHILEPSLVDSDGKQREDVMEVSDPVDLFILPGLAFDRSGRRLGRGGGYYDIFLKKYQEHAMERKWKHPLLDHR
ncbi:5-formyltetrahydrofolate cyclo-ligase, mitochondrial-like isoform X2 [Alnus glutinosa]|uniref:5-formyltetrahydrofolate cyclo-ligase, mitochondrial-like isoform X2 n=1 Tax=Alnus glutinosa TaxID=3517 RepID=UPI002D772547|nr:5-formyltetrahydrofolate cyclo-ligase, mitochondrial-like isoform X2 [Alnus glutinosa]